jgi:hypothetical protein
MQTTIQLHLQELFELLDNWSIVTKRHDASATVQHLTRVVLQEIEGEESVGSWTLWSPINVRNVGFIVIGL